MKLNPRSTLDILEILRQGPASGTVLTLDEAFLGLVEELTHSASKLRFRDASEHQVRTYIVHDPDSRLGVVVKIVPYGREHLVLGLSREFTLLRELSKVPSVGFYSPRGYALFMTQGCLVSVSEMLHGIYLTDFEATTRDAWTTGQNIAALQTALASTPTGAALIAQAHGPYYAPKLRRFAGEVLPDTSLRFDWERFDLSSLETARLEHPVIVSDRSPSNLVRTRGGTMGNFDFGLLLVGVPFEDWSWFIDDPRLRTAIPRSELVQILAESSGMHLDSRLKSLFHRAAFFVNVKQYCIVVRRDEARAKHHLSRARQSAEALSLDEAVRLVETLEKTTPSDH